MVARFVARRTTALYEAATGRAASMFLIFGDEVDVGAELSNGRQRATFRSRDGWIDEDHLGSQRALEVYFIDVGQGDSTFIVTPLGKKILIDGGVDQRALSFLSWKYRLDEPANSVTLDLVVMSHGDADHIAGLTPVLQSDKIAVQRVIHNGIANYRAGVFNTSLGETMVVDGRTCLTTRHSSIGDLAVAPLSTTFEKWRQALERAQPQYEAVDTSLGTIDVGDASVRIEVIGPRVEAHSLPGEPDRLLYRWLESPSETINGHSVVLKITYKEVSFLLSGDLNKPGADYLLDSDSAPDFSAHVLKAPHHGSHDYAYRFLEAVRPQLTVISSGDSPDHGHPRAVFMGAAGKSSRSPEPLIFSTEVAATFAEAAENEVVEATSRDLTPEERAILERVIPVRDSIPHMADMDPSSERTLGLARKFFKRRLHGMINVRTDGEKLYAARRVAAGYWWESYGPIDPMA